MAQPPVLALVALGLGGLAVGWFLNLVIVRLPDGDPVLAPASRCTQCEAPIAGRDLVPVVSYAVLRGRCRACREPIALAYPLVELAAAGLWVAAGYRFGATWALIPFLLLFSTLLAQSVIDLETYRLLDRITFPVLAASVVLVVGVSAVEGDLDGVVLALAGAAGYFTFLLVPALVYPRGMGLGDVKLAALMGLHLGWLHPILCLYALIVACVLGAAVGLALYLARGGKSVPFPFGPWLAAGCVAVVLFSDPVLDLYGATTAPYLS